MMVVIKNNRTDGLSRSAVWTYLNRETMAKHAHDALAAIGILGFDKVGLLGFSLGGFVAQDIVRQAPDLVRKLILTGTGPAGGTGIARVGAVSWLLIIKGLLTMRDPKTYLFFTGTKTGRAAAKTFLARLTERNAGRDKGPSPRAFLRQLAAIKA